MTEERLNDLAQMSIENDTLKALDTGNIIDKFAAAKVRKVKLH